MRNNTLYPYTETNLLENPQKYQMSPYLGKNFLINFFKSRENQLKVLKKTEKFFLEVDEHNQNVYLLDLKNDPLEEQNIATTKPDVVEKMEKTMNQIIQKSTKIESIEMSDDEAKEVEAELKKLGYI